MGSHLTERLLAEGHRVIAIDNLITGNPANIAHLAGNENFRFTKQNVSNYILVEEEIDYVFQFASPASPIDYRELIVRPASQERVDERLRRKPFFDAQDCSCMMTPVC